jgi:hypothetical protein
VKVFAISDIVDLSESLFRSTYFRSKISVYPVWNFEHWIFVLYFQTQRLNEVKREEFELLEAQSIPLRNYLMKHVMPTLTQGLIDCCKTRPDDPIDYIVSVLIHCDMITSIIDLYSQYFPKRQKNMEFFKIMIKNSCITVFIQLFLRPSLVLFVLYCKSIFWYMWFIVEYLKNLPCKTSCRLLIVFLCFILQAEFLFQNNPQVDWALRQCRCCWKDFISVINLWTCVYCYFIYMSIFILKL